MADNQEHGAMPIMSQHDSLIAIEDMTLEQLYAESARLSTLIHAYSAEIYRMGVDENGVPKATEVLLQTNLHYSLNFTKALSRIRDIEFPPANGGPEN
ncbi:hypothetical protein NHQ30_007982 [Ciborinia camelliae]|nr:hypothetical protein NHQ30_007982 [Ciborinia camelliae]